MWTLPFSYEPGPALIFRSLFWLLRAKSSPFCIQLCLVEAISHFFCGVFFMIVPPDDQDSVPWCLIIGGVREPRSVGWTVLLAATCWGPNRTLQQRLPGAVQLRSREDSPSGLSPCRACYSELLSVRNCQPDHAARDGARVAHQGDSGGRAGEFARREVDCGTGPSYSRRTRGHSSIHRRSGCRSSCKCDCGT